uniref:Angiopoietin 2b n=1 Tax=Erpetoichthys calabaricus TaxID=27687 RepID=A0A8C4SLV2_ERPCA
EATQMILTHLESYIQEDVKMEMTRMQRSAAHNQTVAMLEIGTNLLSQSAEQTRKLTDVETQVLNQTSRLEIQLLENSLSTHKLEKQILIQTQEISQLNERNSLLEQRFQDMEKLRAQELQILKAEKLQLQELLMRQSGLIEELDKELVAATLNSTLLQRQQSSLMETVHQLLNMISVPPKEEAVKFKDCVFCDMETNKGGWTVLQRRRDGTQDFHRTWKDYKVGFGDPSGEYWLGNEFLHQLTSSNTYTLRVQLKDWDGNEAFSLYEQFSIGSEEQNYRYSRGYTGNAGRTSSFSHSGTEFSTKDRDNDKCSCTCAQMATGGWWFDACGPSNLNGIYYNGKTSTARYNGIKWYYWKGPSLSLKETTMMIRPVDF